MTLIKSESQMAQRAMPVHLPQGSTRTRERDATAEYIPGGVRNDAAIEKDRRPDMIARIAELEAALQAAAQASYAACAEAEKRGYAKGLDDAEVREAELLQGLRTALMGAVATLDQRFDAERDLAIEIARAALDRLFADPSLYRGMVVETARLQAAGLRGSAAVRLRVSEADFPDAETLGSLPSVDAALTVESDAALAAGSCIFDLTLGTLDASIARQQAVIEHILDQAERRAASA